MISNQIMLCQHWSKYASDSRIVREVVACHTVLSFMCLKGNLFSMTCVCIWLNGTILLKALYICKNKPFLRLLEIHL
jgi:hypothetical protein